MRQHQRQPTLHAGDEPVDAVVVSAAALDPSHGDVALQRGDAELDGLRCTTPRLGPG
jgi:hypothetical protein